MTETINSGISYHLRDTYPICRWHSVIDFRVRCSCSCSKNDRSEDCTQYIQCSDWTILQWSIKFKRGSFVTITWAQYQHSIRIVFYFILYFHLFSFLLFQIVFLYRYIGILHVVWISLPQFPNYMKKHVNYNFFRC